MESGHLDSLDLPRSQSFAVLVSKSGTSKSLHFAAAGRMFIFKMLLIPRSGNILLQSLSMVLVLEMMGI